MSTPPFVSDDDAVQAVARIAARRREIDDPHLWRLTEDPLETLTYLRMYSGGVPRHVAEADLLDGLTLRLRLWWEGEGAELWLLERARSLGVPPRLIGSRLGITTRQGVHGRLRLARAKMQVRPGAPHPGLQPQAEHPTRDAEAAWLHRNRMALRDIAATAVAHRDLADEEAADWLLDVARDLRDSALTPGSLQVLRFALAEVEISAAVASLSLDHPLLKMLERWSLLYATHPGSRSGGGESSAT